MSAAKFIVDDAADTDGTSLLKAIKTTAGRIRALFGCWPGCSDAQAKYSERRAVRHVGTGEVFTLYRCYGEWRIGGRKEACTQLGALLERIEPKRYAGFSKVPSDAICAHSLWADRLPDPADPSTWIADQPAVAAVVARKVCRDDEIPF